MSDRTYVYCSGPLFCPEEIGGMTAISRCLEASGLGTFLPHRDGIEAYVMPWVNSPVNVSFLPVRALMDRAIFALDVYQIVERCAYFVFNMNGRVPDEGGLVEAAIAYAAGKPVVVYKNDARTAFNGMDNSMVTGLVTTRKVADIREIPAELERAARLVGKHGISPYRGANIPHAMARTIRLGRGIWQAMSLVSREAGTPDALIEEIAGMVRAEPEA